MRMIKGRRKVNRGGCEMRNDGCEIDVRLTETCRGYLGVVQIRLGDPRAARSSQQVGRIRITLPVRRIYYSTDSCLAGLPDFFNFHSRGHHNRATSLDPGRPIRSLAGRHFFTFGILTRRLLIADWPALGLFWWQNIYHRAL